MFPVMLDLGSLKTVLVGEGEVAEKRLALLDAAGAAHLEVYSGAPTPVLVKQAGKRLKGARPTGEAFRGARVVFIAGGGPVRWSIPRTSSRSATFTCPR